MHFCLPTATFLPTKYSGNTSEVSSNAKLKKYNKVHFLTASFTQRPKNSYSKSLLLSDILENLLHFELFWVFDMKIWNMLLKQLDQTWSNLFKLDKNGSNWFTLDPNCSNLFKLVQTCSNLIKLDANGSKLNKVAQNWSSWFKMDQIGSNLSKLDQTWLNLIKRVETGSKQIKLVQNGENWL